MKTASGLQVTDDTESTGADSGSITTEGGLGIAKKVHVGGLVDIGQTLNVESEEDAQYAEESITASIKTAGGILAAKDIVSVGNLQAHQGLRVHNDTGVVNAPPSWSPILDGDTMCLEGDGGNLLHGMYHDSPPATDAQFCIDFCEEFHNETQYVTFIPQGGNPPTFGFCACYRSTCEPMDASNKAFEQSFKQSTLTQGGPGIETFQRTGGQGFYASVTTLGGLAVYKDIATKQSIMAHGTTNAQWAVGGNGSVASIQTAGGIGADMDIVARGNVIVGQGLDVFGDWPSANATDGAMTTKGGLGVARNVNVGESMHIYSTANARSDVEVGELFGSLVTGFYQTQVGS